MGFEVYIIDKTGFYPFSVDSFWFATICSRGWSCWNYRKRAPTLFRWI